jgi:membrane-associated phospholipid phosphatase
MSFPSGDAAGAFAVATTIADRSREIYVDVLAYGLAGLAAFYRVHDKKHWPSDVFTGSLLGYFIAKKICALNRGNNRRHWDILVGLSGQGRSVTLIYYF